MNEKQEINDTQESRKAEEIIESYKKSLREHRQKIRDGEKEIIDMEIDFETFPQKLTELSDTAFLELADGLEGILFHAILVKHKNLYDSMDFYDTTILAQAKAFLIAKYHLKERCRRLNEKFPLNDENKKKIIRLNEMFAEKNNEALKEASMAIDELESKTIKDYTVEIKLTPDIIVPPKILQTLEPYEGIYYYLKKFLPEFKTKIKKINGVIKRDDYTVDEAMHEPDLLETFIGEKLSNELQELANGVWAWEDCLNINTIKKEIIISYKLE